MRIYNAPLVYRLIQLRYILNRNTSRPVFKHIRPIECYNIIGHRQWDKYFKFCFVRNPFDRLVSLYFYQKQKISHRHSPAKYLTFEQWVLSGGSGSARLAMSDFVCDEAGNIIVDFIGRYEQLEHDFDTVCRILGIEATLLHINKGHHTHYSAYYTKRARLAVESRFAKDLEIFDYQFEQQ